MGGCQAFFLSSLSIVLLEETGEGQRNPNPSLHLIQLCPTLLPQCSTAGFKDQCGLPTVAKLKQCIQSLATRLQSPEGTMGATMLLREGYPCLEPQVSLSEATRKLLSAYDTVSSSERIHNNPDPAFNSVSCKENLKKVFLISLRTQSCQGFELNELQWPLSRYVQPCHSAVIKPVTQTFT